MRPNPYIEISFPIRFCFPLHALFSLSSNGKGTNTKRTLPGSLRIVFRILGSDTASTLNLPTPAPLSSLTYSLLCHSSIHIFLLPVLQWRDFSVCLVSVRVPKMSFGRANKLNSIFCRRAKLLKTRLLPSCGNSYHPYTHPHTHSYRSHVRATWSYYMVYLNSIYASHPAPNLQLCLMTSCA